MTVKRKPPDPAAALPPPALNGQAKLKWYEMKDVLLYRNILTFETLDLLAVYCDAYATWHEAVSRIAQTTYLTKSPRDGIVVSPWVTIRDGAAATMDRIGRQLGLSPDHEVEPKPLSWEEFYDSTYGAPNQMSQTEGDVSSSEDGVDDDLDDDLSP